MAKVKAATESRSQAAMRRALWLLAFTILYNIMEGIIAVYFGTEARSTSLVTFGIDSGIESAAAGVLLWRMAVQARGAEHEATERAEHRARRFIGLTFFALSVYVAVEAGLTLWNRDAPETSGIGIILTILSLIVMPALTWFKLRTARQLGSKALESEAKETLACSWLSAITLGGLGLNAVLGWWWADPVAGLAMIPWLVKEGEEAWAGDECCH